MLISRYSVKLVKEDSINYPVKKIKCPSDIFDAMQKHFDGLDREKFSIILLDIKNNIIGINDVSIGGLDVTVVHPREVFKTAILTNAAHIILSHFHPSGDVTPSEADVDITKQLVEAGKILGIKILDHIIVGDGYRSLREYKYVEF